MSSRTRRRARGRSTRSPRWVSSAALASPVVPDVKMRTAASSSATCDRGRRRRAVRRRRGPPESTASTLMPTSPRSPASAGVVTSTAAPPRRADASPPAASAERRAAPRPLPAAGVATNAPTNAGLFGSQIATHRPGAAPAPRKAPAHASICRPSSRYEIHRAAMEQGGALRQTFARRLDEEARSLRLCAACPARKRQARHGASPHLTISLPETCLGAGARCQARTRARDATRADQFRPSWQATAMARCRDGRRRRS